HVMGLGSAQLDRIGPPRDELQALAMGSLPDDKQLPVLIETSLQQRADLAALDVELAAAQVQTRLAYRNQEPRLDAQAELGYTGLAEGQGAEPFVTAPYQNVAGVNFYAGLVGQFPVQNRAARGALLQRQAIAARLQLLRDNLKRQIGVNLAGLVAALRSAQRALVSADAAVQAYQGAVEDERKKLRAGLSTVFDLVQVQARLNSATQSALSARARVASLLAQARFETGTLIEGDGRDYRLRSDDLLLFPSVPER
ncbi:MAG TPA: TolC family protein, partial [Pseudomonadota bacterium]|nr:TolC family protein [Pseudomonadota bacterium]